MIALETTPLTAMFQISVGRHRALPQFLDLAALAHVQWTPPPPFFFLSPFRNRVLGDYFFSLGFHGSDLKKDTGMRLGKGFELRPRI
jgi:hypothetical protein